MWNTFRKCINRYLALYPLLLAIPFAYSQNPPLPPDPSTLVQWMAGTVLCIEIQGKNNDGTSIQKLPQGSGFLVSRQGHVLTNSHVVRPFRIKDSPYQIFETTGIRATFHERCDFNRDGGYDLEIVGFDDHIDLALLKIKQGGPTLKRDAWRYVPLDNSDYLRPGDKLITLGFPDRRHYFDSDGEIRALDEANGRTLFKGPMEPGYSGGPVLDMRGFVVGVVWGGVLDRRNANYFIPINHAVNLLRLSGARK